MKKLFATGEKGILTEIEEKAKVLPCSISLEHHDFPPERAYRVKGSFLSYKYDKQILDEQRETYLETVKPRKVQDKIRSSMELKDMRELSGYAKSQFTLRRNQAIRAMINDRVWSDELAGLYEIDELDVKHHHSVHIRMRVILNSRPEAAFKEYLRQKGIAAFEQERQKVLIYQNGGRVDNPENYSKEKPLGFVNAIIGRTAFERENNLPRLLIEEQLFGRDAQGRSEVQMLSDEIESYRTETIECDRAWFHYEKKITQYEYNKHRDRLNDEIKSLQNKNARLYKLLFLDNEANENVTFIKAVGKKNLEEYFDELEVFSQGESGRKRKPVLQMPGIGVSSTGQGEALIKEFVRWFNKKYIAEIRANQAIEETKATQLRNDKSRVEGRVKKLDSDAQVIGIYQGGETNSAEIARILDQKPRTVRGIVDRYLAVVELHRKGVTIPEAISDQTGTKIRTIEFYLELITGETVSANTLTSAQQSELEQAEKEELEARDAFEEREVKRLDQERVRAVRDQIASDVVKYHKIGFSPSKIHKHMNLSLTKIRNILTERNFTPHFDYKYASEQEIEAWKKERQKEDEERGRNRPKLDF